MPPLLLSLILNEFEDNYKDDYRYIYDNYDGIDHDYRDKDKSLADTESGEVYSPHLMQDWMNEYWKAENTVVMMAVMMTTIMTKSKDFHQDSLMVTQRY